jgi:hypothetical protein
MIIRGWQRKFYEPISDSIDPDFRLDLAASSPESKSHPPRVNGLVDVHVGVASFR